MSNTLNRKYLLQAIEGSLERLDLEFVDLLYCHRADPNTPIEETVWAMSDIVASGQATYWGTSEWTADEIRGRVGRRGAPSPAQAGGGAAASTTSSPAGASSASTHGCTRTSGSASRSGARSRPASSPGSTSTACPRAAAPTLPGYEWLAEMLTDPASNEKVRKLGAIAGELDCSLAQLSLAWCAKNPNVSSVITGASRPEQVSDNLGALDVLARSTTT